MRELPEPGAIIGGRYRILEELGRGGMGVVYEAEHTSLGRTVALKMLLPSVLVTDELIFRFLREARSAAAIGHPGIVDVFDLSQPGEPPFLVMEKLEGEELRKRIQRNGQLPLIDVWRIGAELCSAVAAAHEHGIIHRDLKPDNVFLAKHGDGEIVKVLDFGIAKLVRQAPNELNLTKPGAVYGTPIYMAPEQMRGGAIDARTDLYSIGVILFEALAGSPPFVAETFAELVVKVTVDPPPDLLDRRPDIPVALADLIQRCLAKSADERPSGPAELAHALARVDRGKPHASSGSALALASTLAAVEPLETLEALEVKPRRRRFLTKSILWGLGGSVLLLTAALAGAVGWSELEEDMATDQRRAEMGAFISGDRDGFLEALRARMEGRAAMQMEEPSARRSVGLYDDLRLYLLLTGPRTKGEPGLDGTSDSSMRNFAQAHVAAAGPGDTERRTRFIAFIDAFAAEDAERGDDALAQRDSAIVSTTREALTRVLREEHCLASLEATWATDQAIPSRVLTSPEILLSHDTVSRLFTPDGYDDVRFAFEPELLRLEPWVNGRESERDVEVLMIREAYSRAYYEAWLAVLDSARWQVPEEPNLPEVRTLLTAAAREPISPVEHLVSRVLESARLRSEELSEADRASTGNMLEETGREILNERFVPLASALELHEGPSLLTRHRQQIQTLLTVVLDAEDGPLDHAAQARLHEVRTQVRVMVDAQDPQLRDFYNEMLWRPVELASSVLNRPDD